MLLRILVISFILSQSSQILGQSSKPIHKVLGMVVHSINGTDTVAYTGEYDVFLFDDSGQNPDLFLQTREKPKFSVNLNQQQLNNYSHIMVVTNQRIIPYGSVPCTTKVNIPYRNNTKCMFTVDSRNTFTHPNSVIVKKPVIYIYPEHDQITTIKHKYHGEVTFTYPEYRDGWSIVAKPDGSLLNLEDSTEHRYLFWEGMAQTSLNEVQRTEGFIVKSHEIIPFLEKTLKKLGLNPIESNDFITFWAPRMMIKNQSFLHFLINDNIRNTSFLDITPKPKTLIRIFMEYSHSIPDTPIKEQSLPTLQREGYTIIEWGGTELGSKIIH
ncbi:MAG: hypothetical protein EBU66_05180 [Bacteroidetes bacterium]|nr:hypothetical protein [Bacteroidota bacterium]